MTSDPPDLGKGLFGYRKSAVNQILADRDVMLRQAEGRVRAAESKVADLQNELTSMKDRNTRMDEQLERLRAQVDALSARAEAAPPPPQPTFYAPEPPAPEPPAPEPPAPETPAIPSADAGAPWEGEMAGWDDQWSPASEGGLAPYDEGAGAAYEEYGETAASFEGLDHTPPPPEAEPTADIPRVIDGPEQAHTEPDHAADLFGSGEWEGESPGDLMYATPASDPEHRFGNWSDSEPPPAPEPMRKVDEMLYQPEDHPEHAPSSLGGEDEATSAVAYGFSLHPASPEEGEEPADIAPPPAFRGFSEASFDEPSPSQYLSGPGMTETAPPAHGAEPAPPEWPAQPAEQWASQAPQPAPEPVPDWTTQSAPSAPDWSSQSAPPAPEWPQPSSPMPDWMSAQPSVPPAEWAPPPARAAEPAAPAPTPPQPAPAPAVSPQSSDITNRFLTEELKGILSAAEESAARILERARVTSEHQVAQSNRLWREVQAELARFSSWRDQVEPIIRSVHAKVESVRAQIEEVPDKIRQALAPMADSISMIDSDLAELASASTPPLLLTPSGLDPGSSVPDWSTPEAEPSSPGLSEGRPPGSDEGHLAG